MTETCVNSLWHRTLSTFFCCNYEGARNRPHRAVLCTLCRLIEQAGSYADMERHVPGLYDWVQKNNEAAPVMRCAILDVVSWFPGVPQELWMDVSVRCPHAERYNGENEALWNGRASVGLGDLWKTGRRGHQVAEHVAMDAGEDDGEAPAAVRPEPLLEVLSQERVQQRTAEQIVLPCAFGPVAPRRCAADGRKAGGLCHTSRLPCSRAGYRSAQDRVSTPRCSHTPYRCHQAASRAAR